MEEELMKTERVEQEGECKSFDKEEEEEEEKGKEGEGKPCNSNFMNENLALKREKEILDFRFWRGV